MMSELGMKGFAAAANKYGTFGLNINSFGYSNTAKLKLALHMLVNGEHFPWAYNSIITTRASEKIADHLPASLVIEFSPCL